MALDERLELEGQLFAIDQQILACVVEMEAGIDFDWNEDECDKLEDRRARVLFLLERFRADDIIEELGV